MLNKALDCDMEWVIASNFEEKGKYKKAALIYEKCAKYGHVSSQLSIAYCYHYGLGVKKDLMSEFYWNRRAYRKGDCADKTMAASNIGTTYRDLGNYKRAIFWLRRAANMQPYPDEDARLTIARIYVKNPRNKKRALQELHFLLEKANPELMTEATREEAQDLLAQLEDS